MTRTKNKNQSKTKLKKDGEAIADVERAVAKLKRREAPKGRKVSHKVGRPKEEPINAIVQLMGRQEEAEAAYLATLIDCEEVQAPIPSTQTIGYVPTDRWIKPVYYTVTTNASNIATVAIEDDCWNSGGGGGLYGILPAGSDQSTCVTHTGKTYVGTSFPANGVALATGVTDVIMSNVSSEFVSNANTGTEYIQVANVTHLQCEEPPSADAGDAFVGSVSVVFTYDPESHPIMGKTIDELRATAALRDSKIVINQFHITRDGLFVPLDGLNDRYADSMSRYLTGTYNHEGKDLPVYSTLHSYAVPVHDDSYIWRRIGERSLQGTGYTVNFPSQGFYIESPEGTEFQCRTTYLWQTEEFESSKVVSAWDWINQWDGTDVTKPFDFPIGGPGSGAPGFPAQMDYELPEYKWPKSRSLMPSPPTKTNSTTPKTKRAPMPRSSSLHVFINSSVKSRGIRPHPLLPQACVIAARCRDIPGFHAQLASARAEQLSNFLPTMRSNRGLILHPMAKSMVGRSGGENAPSRVAEEWDWGSMFSKFGSMAVDLLPVLLKMLA